MQRTVGARLGDVADLLGFDLARRPPARTVNLTLYWRARQETSTSYKVFVHLLDAKSDHLGPARRRAPERRRPHHLLDPWRDHLGHLLHPVQAGAPPGEYDIEIGMYSLPSGARLPVTNATGQSNRRPSHPGEGRHCSTRLFALCHAPSGACRILSCLGATPHRLRGHRPGRPRRPRHRPAPPATLAAATPSATPVPTIVHRRSHRHAGAHAHGDRHTQRHAFLHAQQHAHAGPNPGAGEGRPCPASSWVGQTWNNCAPASLSMVLGYYGVKRGQDEIARALHPEAAGKHVGAGGDGGVPGRPGSGGAAVHQRQRGHAAAPGGQRHTGHHLPAGSRPTRTSATIAS